MSSAVVNLLRDLIAIPSVNPDGDPGVAETGEASIAAFVAEFLEELQAEVIIEEVLPNRPNVIARFPASTSKMKPRVLLAPHLDTVSVANMKVDPFGGEIRDGKIYGRGACDTKGTMAAMLTALQELGPERIAGLGAEVTFVGLMGEETLQHGSRHFAKHHPDYDFALVGEPTECDIVHVHKGDVWLDIITTGKAVHGSTPHLGENAVAKMAPIIEALHVGFTNLLAEERWRHPVLGSPTINIGMCRGGIRNNIVPDECRLSLDIRVTPALYEHGTLALLEEFCREQGVWEAIEIEVTSSCAPLDTDAANPFVQQLKSLGSNLVGAPWFCDAAFLSSEGGIPAVAAGPGSIAQAHTVDEWIAIDELERGVDFYRRFLESFPIGPAG